MQPGDYYRRRAKEVRRLGETLSNPELRKQMDTLAKEYEYLAVAAEHMRRLSEMCQKGSAEPQSSGSAESQATAYGG